MPSIRLLQLALVGIIPVQVLAYTSINAAAKVTPSATTTLQSITTTNWNGTVTRNVTLVHTPTASVSISLQPSVSSEAFPNWQPEWFLNEDSVPSGQGNLPQDLQNGKSSLGSVDAPTYPIFCDGPGNGKSFPWGSRTAGSTDPYHNAPDTGVTRRYTFVVERGMLAPDGVMRQVILVNGEFPGPTLEANWGDYFEITVINKITGDEEGTSIHWHGLLQKGTQYADGVPGVTQCPIAPGQTFTYRFQADLYGTSWWHAHYSAQYAAGLYGAMIIHGPIDNAKYDADLGPILISDYFHDDYYGLVEDTMSTDIKRVVVKADNNLINGKGIFNCTFAPDKNNCDPNAGLSKFHFKKGQSYRLRLINAGAEALQKFSIDNHKMTVIAYDFVPIVPHETTIVTLSVGQRADVIVTADGDVDDIVWMRSTMTSCSNTNQPNALAMIYYDNADQTIKPKSTAWPDTTDPCANDDLTTAVPFYTITPPEPDMELEIDVNFGKNASGNYVFTMNNSTFRTNYNKPVLPYIQGGATKEDCPEEWNVYDIGAAKAVRITINNHTPIVHPMHLHGHNMYVLSSLSSQPSGFTGVNMQNPTRRDTHILPPKGQIVLQLDGDNPGVWPLHCHIAWHVSGGLYVNILENGDALKNGPAYPAEYVELCRTWDHFTNTDYVDQIDSGL